MPNLEHLILLVITAGSLYLAADALLRVRRLGAAIAGARHHAPIDDSTGLLDAGVLELRLQGELRRARRFDGSLCVLLLHAPGAAPDVLGQQLEELLDFPQVAFGAGPGLYVVAAPNQTTHELDLLEDLLTHLGGRASGTSRASFPTDADSVDELLHVARRRLEAARTPVRAGA